MLQRAKTRLLPFSFLIFHVCNDRQLRDFVFLSDLQFDHSQVFSSHAKEAAAFVDSNFLKIPLVVVTMDKFLDLETCIHILLCT